MLLGCQYGSRKETNILVRQQKFKIRTHIAELHRKILTLHGHGENPLQIVNRALAPQRKQRNLLSLDISGLEEGQPLNVIPMEVGKRDDNGLLSKSFISHDFLTKTPDSCAGIDYPDIYRVIRCNENAAGAPAELVVLSSANRDRPATTVNLDPDFGIAFYLRLRVLHRGESGDKPRTMQERRREAISDDGWRVASTSR